MTSQIGVSLTSREPTDARKELALTSLNESRHDPTQRGANYGICLFATVHLNCLYKERVYRDGEGWGWIGLGWGWGWGGVGAGRGPLWDLCKATTVAVSAAASVLPIGGAGWTG